MARRPSTPLGMKVILIVAATCTLLLSVFALLMVRRQEHLELHNVYASASRISETLRLTTYYDMLMDRRDSVYRMMDTVGHLPGIIRIRIYNKEGKITYSSDKQEQGRIVNKESEACFTCHAKDTPLTRLEMSQRFRIFQGPRNERVLGLIQPIYNERSCYDKACHAHPADKALLGVFDIQMSLMEADQSLTQNRNQILVFTLMFIIIIPAVAGLFIYWFVHRPVHDLSNATARIAEGDLAHRIQVRSHDEIGQLADSFNEMSARLQAARQELEQWTDTLEERVQDKSRQLQLAQDQIIQTEKMASLGRLSAVVAHEINNPLAGIFTYTKLIRRILGRGNLPEEKIPEVSRYLEIMENETGRCGRIVKELLAFARGGGASLERLQPNDIVRAVLNLMNYRLNLQQIRVELLLDERLPEVEVNGDKVQQAVLCLVTNACEAMPDGGTLTARTQLSADSRMVELTIGDTGPGIPEDIRDSIFEPFLSTKTRGMNLGLGLFVASGNIQRHGGQITFTTEMGRGTEFTISLPLEPVTGEAPL
jgi:two-component system NtrC family sensor kinase